LKNLITLAFILVHISILAQIGINTTDPKGSLDITSTNNTGAVLPRVSDIEDVTDGQGNPPVNGTAVYDISRNKTCFYQDSRWICIGLDSSGLPVVTDETPVPPTNKYIKASNTGSGDSFGFSVSINSSGNTLAVGAPDEENGSGAVYIFTRTGDTWIQEELLKASNAGASTSIFSTGDQFGHSVSLSGDGNTLAVGAIAEESTIVGDPTDNSSSGVGAAYIFTRTGATWTEEAYIKASNAGSSDDFGTSIALSDDGDTLAVGAPDEDTSGSNSGAVYIFTRTNTIWTEQQLIKASNSGSNDSFGDSVTLSDDGNTLAAGATGEDSTVNGINGNESNNGASGAGAVYVFTRSGTTWVQEAYIKASNTDENDFFGFSITLSNDGNTLAVGATGEDSASTGVNGNQGNDISSANSITGAVYVFNRISNSWTQQAYIKHSTFRTGNTFGTHISLSNDGNTLAVGAPNEDSVSTGTNSVENNFTGPPTAFNSGAAYIFNRVGTTWSQQAYIKASNTGSGDQFSRVALSGNANILAVGAISEDSMETGIHDATGVNSGNQTDNSAMSSGAVYIITDY